MVRTPTTLAWLLELLPDVAADWRIQLVFTINGDRSAYSTGLDEMLAAAGLPVIPWEQALALRFDLAISASHLGGIEALQAPLLVLPHGPGHSRMTSMPSRESIDAARRADPEAADDRIVYALPHDSFLHALPVGAEPRITGDPAFDMILASATRRSEYRAALGVGNAQRLVLVSSTWGPASLLAVDPEIFESLLRTLPFDEYVVAAVLHPNVWVGHGEWQVRLWLRRALDAGLRLIPYQRGWRPTVIASDLVLGDHGSVTFYAAAAGKPVWLRTHGGHEMIETPPRSLGDSAPRFTRVSDLRTLFAGPNPLVVDGIGESLRRQTFAFEGEATTRLRALIYELIGLEEPSAPPVRAAAVLPSLQWRIPQSFYLRLGDDHGRVRVERTPAEPGAPDGDGLRLLVAHADERRVDILESADLVIAGQPGRAGEPVALELEAILSRLPGAAAASSWDPSARTHLIHVRDGAPLLVRELGTGTAPAGVISATALGREAGAEFVVLLGEEVFAARVESVSPR